MSLKDQLKTDMKEAMKAREAGKVALSVIRMVNSAIKNTEIDKKIELEDSDIIAILAKEMKIRQDSLAEFEKELVEQRAILEEIRSTVLAMNRKMDEIDD